MLELLKVWIREDDIQLRGRLEANRSKGDSLEGGLEASRLKAS